MRVTILHRYFWPQKYPYAQMLKDISEAVNNTGHDVRVMTTTDGTDQEIALREKWKSDKNIAISVLSLGSEKHRGVIRKSFNAVYYGVWAFMLLLFRRTDIVMVATTPPIIVAALVRWAAYFGGFKYIYHCQDIYPEMLLLNSNVTRGALYRFLLKIDVKNINRAWRVITLSEDMKHTIQKRGCRVDHVNIINNFAFEEMAEKSQKESTDDHVRFLFAGSLGRFQNLELLVQAIKEFRDNSKVEFVFMGDGIFLKRLKEIKKEFHLDNVKILGQRSVQEAVVAMNEADFGIVSIAPGVCGVAYPSKAVMYLGNGLPIFALVDSDTELSRFIDNNELGVTSSPSSVSKIIEGIEKAIEINMQQPISRKYIKKVATDNFGKDTSLEKISGVFAE